MLTAEASAPMAAPAGPRPASARRFGPKRSMIAPGQRTLTVGTCSVVVYLFVVHSYKLDIGTVAILAGLMGVIAFQRPLRYCAPIAWHAAFLAWSLATLPASIDVATSTDAWIDSFKILLITWLAFNAIRTRGQHRLITLAWLGMFALYPVRGTLFNFLSGNGSFGRYGWNFTFANFNDMAALTLFPLAMSLERLRSTDKPWVRICALCGVIALPFIVLITQSRAGMLGLALMLLYVLARSRYKVRLASSFAGVALVAALFAPQGVWDRIRGMQYLTSVETLGQSDSSAEQRYMIWQVAETVIADNFLIGVGIGAYPIAHGEYVTKKEAWAFASGQRDAHNTYFRVMAETGIVGLGLFLMIFISMFRELAKTSKAHKEGTTLEAKQLRDRCQAYQSALLGVMVCAIFGSMQAMVFPFLFIALGSAAIRMGDPVQAPALRKKMAQVRQRMPFGRAQVAR